jgi:hypothetical protein
MAFSDIPSLDYRLDRSRLAYFVVDDAAFSRKLDAMLKAVAWPQSSSEVVEVEDVRGLRVPCLINPTSLKESMQANYSERAVLGLSHGKQQYIRTSARKVSFSLFFNAHVLARILLNPTNSEGPDIAELMLQAKAFYYSLLVPRAARQAPPLVAFVWPQANMRLRGYVESINTVYERFAYDGRPIEFTMEMSMIAQPRDLMTSGPVSWGGLVSAAQIG